MVDVALPPADLPSACAVLAGPRPDAHSAPLPFRRLMLTLARPRVLASPRGSSAWATAGPTSSSRPRSTPRTRCCTAARSASCMQWFGMRVAASLASVSRSPRWSYATVSNLRATAPWGDVLATGSRRSESRPKPHCEHASATGRGLRAIAAKSCAGARAPTRRDQSANGGRPAVPPQLGRQQPPE
jgi:hypothetical protein